MKLVTKIAAIATLATFMFAGVNLTWGNSYADADGELGASGSFGVHFDVNDNTTVGWENGLMVGLAGPAGATFRLGYETTIAGSAETELSQHSEELDSEIQMDFKSANLEDVRKNLLETLAETTSKESRNWL